MTFSCLNGKKPGNTLFSSAVVSLLAEQQMNEKRTCQMSGITQKVNSYGIDTAVPKAN